MAALTPRRHHAARLAAVALAGALPGSFPSAAIAQAPPPAVVNRDSVTIAAGSRYSTGWFTRLFLGDTYRDYWVKPVRAPVLDIRGYAGGLTPLKEGGGKQTRTLRLGNPMGYEFVFRPVDKATVNPPERLRGTIVEAMFRDQITAMFPAAGIVAAPIVDAAGIIHATPQLVVMPNDSVLGKYREYFAGRFASIEEYPNVPADAPGFAGAADIIDSDKLLSLLDSTAAHRVDEPAFLNARLTDILIGDIDRHHGNWKWARMGSDEPARWVPLPRDRDHSFHTYNGILGRMASIVAPNLTTFEGRYPKVKSLSVNAREVDRRLLGGLEKSVWDSVASALASRITDRVIDSAVLGMPVEYRAAAPGLAAKLKQRRDGLPAIARAFYAELARVVDVHATDAPDRATVTYMDGGMVEVRLQSGSEAPYFNRRFDARETAEVRVYLHDGDDAAVVSGNAPYGTRIRIIGGNGNNEITDSSRVGGGRRASLYDVGQISDVNYGPDSLRDTLFNRRPWVNDTGSFEPPPRDFGRRFKPTGGFGGGSGLGLVPKLGVQWTNYGFRKYPYSSRVGLEAEYSTRVSGYRVTATADRRLESSRVHFMGTARMSDFEVVNFHGFGNDTDGDPEEFYEVRQRQWLFHPTVALALGRRESDLTFGPVVQYSTTDSTTDKLISDARPYGFGDFGQAGVRLGMRYDTRDSEAYATRGFLVDVNGSSFPAVWDVENPFSQLTGSATTFFELPIPLRPTLAFRGGGRKVWGDAPFFESAFIGGRGTVRGMDAQRYAGDASLYGTSELRVPLAKLRFIIPLDIGALGFIDAGRVWVDGDSPGGWHTVAGGGLWFGIIDPGTGFSVTITNSDEKRLLIGTGLRF
jgi:hypothetical protein